MTPWRALIRGGTPAAVVVAMLAFEHLGAQTVPCVKGNALSETFQLRGTALDSMGLPLGSLGAFQMHVIVFPYAQPNGEAVTRYFWGNKKLQKEPVPALIARTRGEQEYNTGDDGPLVMQNSTAVIDTNGAFSIRVEKDLFKDPCGCVTCQGYKLAELGLGVFNGGGKSFKTPYEVEAVKFDLNAATVDAGRLRFKTMSTVPQSK